MLCFAIFLVAMYVLTGRMYTRWFAVVVVAALCLGSDRVLKDELVAHGGSTELKAAVALLFLLSMSLAMRTTRHRAVAYLTWGLLAGFVLWDHLIAVPYLAAAGGALVVCCGRELAGRMGLLLGAGVSVAAAPLLSYNLVAGPGEDSLSTFVQLVQAAPPMALGARLSGGILTGVPMSTGMCDPGTCTPWQQAWALVFLILLVASASLAVRALRRTLDTTQRARQWLRIALVASAVVTIGSYAGSAPAGLWPNESVRYLSCLLVSLPIVLWPLWCAVGQTRQIATTMLPRLVWGAATALLAFAGVVMLTATAQVVIRAAPTARTFESNQRALLDELGGARVRHVYSEYWTCNRLTFVSEEHIICAVLSDDLRSGFDRYEPYRAAVAADSRAAYAFPAGSAIDVRFQESLRSQSRSDAPSATVGGYDVYLPSSYSTSARSTGQSRD